jgi:hypothetical protein
MKPDFKRAAENEAYRNELRWRAQTELFWLAKFVLGYVKLTEQDHKEVADKFVKKDPTKPFEQQDKKKKRRIFLMPRKTYKTTLNIADSVQWVVGFPDIAIMAMTASNSPDSPLADAFVAEIASHFLTTNGERSNLCILFPEHEIVKMPKDGLFTTPARTKFRRDPTVKGVSIEQSLSGWHPDIIKSEDVQDNRNSQTAFALRKVRTNFYINLKMLGEDGHLDITGTRYGPADLYGDMIQKQDERTILLWKPAYVRKPHAMKLKDDELTEDDVILNFPRQLSWDFLRSEKAIDENSFWTQYMNIAEGNFKPTFPLEKLHAAKIPEDAVPLHGTIHIAWRFQYAEQKNDAAAVGVQEAGRMAIVEVLRGSFSPSVLAREVVALAKKWQTHRTEIEDTPGARLMEQHIQNEALEQNWHIGISWSEFYQEDTARRTAIKSAEPHLQAGRLLFSEGMDNFQLVSLQLYQFGLIEETEIASVVSRVAAQLPVSIAAEHFDRTDEEAWERVFQNDAYYRVFGNDEPAPSYQPEEYADKESITPSYAVAGLEDIMPGLTG